jgi:hypothetical protein
MEQSSTGNFTERQQLALSRYQELIQWYEKHKRSQRRVYQLLQGCVILFSGLTPILILIDQTPKALQALPAALAGIFTAILATFRFQDNYVRFGLTLELLKSELFRYEMKAARAYAPGVDEQKALERFVEKMEDLIRAEVMDWRQTVLNKEEQSE